MAGGYAVLYLLLPDIFGLHPVARLNVALASASAMLLHTLGVTVAQSQTVLSLHGASVVVTDDCNGVGAWLLVVGAMAALPSIAWSRRLLGIVGSAIVLMAVNATRISMLCYLQATWPASFSTVHEQIMPLVIVLTAAACYAIWLRGVAHAHRP